MIEPEDSALLRRLAREMRAVLSHGRDETPLDWILEQAPELEDLAGRLDEAIQLQSGTS